MKSYFSSLLLFFFVLGIAACEDDEVFSPNDSPEVAAARLLVDEIDGLGITLRLPDGSVRTLPGSAAFLTFSGPQEIVVTNELLGCEQTNLVVVSGSPQVISAAVSDTLSTNTYCVKAISYNLAGGGAVENGTRFFNLLSPQDQYVQTYPLTITVVDRNEEVFSGTITGRYHFTVDPQQNSIPVEDLIPYGEIIMAFKVASPFRCN